MAEEKMTFEKKIQKLENIAREIQDSDTELEKAIELFEKGMKLAKEVDKELSKAERKIELVTSSYEDDEIVTESYS